ncbi:MAG: 16S rRNA (cytosine(967)-C(5))-methyltransferase RsmB [Wenzhouxiangellaceae bacterium]|nr:16S rRNA (cytosine(967)-C(5))-methyltransferase RsmB [Wenzhouxiangellaceae bacterium]
MKTDAASTGAAPRAAAARALSAVLDRGRALGDALAEELTALPQARDRALTRRLCNRVLRDRPALEWRLRRQLHKPLARKLRVVHCLLLAALDQLAEGREPAPAIVHATVAACRQLGHPRLTGLVNAVLRNDQRDTGRDAEQPDTLAFRTGYPDWLAERIAADWPVQAEAILTAGNRPPPTWLRVNLRRTTVDELQRRLAEQGIEAHTVAWAPAALRLETPQPISALPGYAEGLFSVQDAGAQHAAALLDLHDGQQVLDACAAPGGKAAHLLECADVDLTAVELEPARAATLRTGLERLKLDARIVVGDAAKPETWCEPEQRFDRILIDAPCSATGVIRRHPDIRWLRRPDDIATNQALQQHLLEALWPRLRPGGLLVYATCSVLHAENRDTLRAFRAAHPEAADVDFELEPSEAMAPGVQLLPGTLDCDGFYYAGLRRLH